MDVYDDLHWRLYGVELAHDDFYDIEGRPSPPKTLRSGRCTYSKQPYQYGIFEFDGHDLATLHELNALASQVYWDRGFTKPWISAQLECYGVSFRKSDSKAVLIGILADMVRSRKVCPPARLAVPCGHKATELTLGWVGSMH